MENRIVKVLKKFNVKFKERGDAIEFKVDDNKIVLSAFDDETQLCTYSQIKTIPHPLKKGTAKIFDEGYATYENVVQMILYNFY